MSKFNVSKFAANPSSELSTIDSAKKNDLIELATVLQLDVRSCKKKEDIKRTILEYYCAKGLVGHEARQYLPPETSELTAQQRLEFERLNVDVKKLN